jgi:hypothetical protein
MTLDIKGDNLTEYLNFSPDIYVGGYHTTGSVTFRNMDATRSYDTNSFVWYTPCAVQYQRWMHFFNIFSVEVWVCFALSLVFAVMTARLISNYGNKQNLNETKSYTNIFSATSNIISVLLSVSVQTQPRSAPLRLFFFCWVWYSVVISTVFQAYLTSFLMEPGYEEPIRTVDQMLEGKKKFGIVQGYEELFDTSYYANSAVFNKAVRCSSVDECFTWANVHHNISIILSDTQAGSFREFRTWSDENNRPLLCTLKDGIVTSFGIVFFVRKAGYLLKHINDIIVRLVEGGLLMHIKKQSLDKREEQTKYNSANLADSYTAVSIAQLQTPFYILLLGYILAFACFVIEMLWHCYKSKRRVTNGRSVCNRQTYI